MNILLGAGALQSDQNLIDSFIGFVRHVLEMENIKIGLLDLCKSPDEITESIKTNMYDVVICPEILAETSIGQYSLCKWFENKPNLNVILLVHDERKSGVKLRCLYESVNYYNALYVSDFTGDKLAALLFNPRKKEEAYYYYGLN